MEQDDTDSPNGQLSAFIGEWSMEADFPGSPATDVRARTVFEWMAGGRFVVQRWEIPDPAAPDGIALIGAGSGSPYLQHYFDSRGVARVYQMSFADGEWKLWRESADFSPLDFSQRFAGTFSEDLETINGRWEKSVGGESWEHDFNLVYTKVS
jgi:hypothetical protein